MSDDSQDFENQEKAKALLMQREALDSSIEETEHNIARLEIQLRNLRYTRDTIQEGLERIPVQLKLFEEELHQQKVEATKKLLGEDAPPQ